LTSQKFYDIRKLHIKIYKNGISSVVTKKQYAVTTAFNPSLKASLKIIVRVFSSQTLKLMA
jgi:hypothetical protein